MFFPPPYYGNPAPPAAAGTQFFLPDARFEMPELLVPGRKPLGAVGVNWHHPLSNGLAYMFLFREEAGDSYDLVRRYKLTESGGTIPRKKTWRGNVLEGDFGSGSYWFTGGNESVARGASELTVFCVAQNVASAPATDLIVSQHSGSSSGSFYLGHNSNLQFTVINSSPSRVDHQVSQSGYDASNRYSLTGVYNGANLRILFNGIQAGGTSAQTGTTRDFAAEFMVGRYDGSSQGGWGYEGIIELIILWTRALSNAQILSVHRNPYQILMPA